MDPSTSHSDRICNAEKNRFLKSVYSREEIRQSREGLWSNYGLRVPSRSRERAISRSLVSRTATRLGFGSSLSGDSSSKPFGTDKGSSHPLSRRDTGTLSNSQSGLGLMFTVKPGVVHKPKQYGLEAPLTISSSAAVGLLLRSHKSGANIDINELASSDESPTKEQLQCWRDELQDELISVENRLETLPLDKEEDSSHQRRESLVDSADARAEESLVEVGTGNEKLKSGEKERTKVDNEIGNAKSAREQIENVKSSANNEDTGGEENSSGEIVDTSNLKPVGRGLDDSSNSFAPRKIGLSDALPPTHSSRRDIQKSQRIRPKSAGSTRSKSKGSSKNNLQTAVGSARYMPKPITSRPGSARLSRPSSRHITARGSGVSAVKSRAKPRPRSAVTRNTGRSFEDQFLRVGSNKADSHSELLTHSPVPETEMNGLVGHENNQQHSHSKEVSLLGSRSQRSVSVSQHTARLNGPNSALAVTPFSRRPKSAISRMLTKGEKSKVLKKPNIEISRKGSNKSRGRTPRPYRSAPSLAPPESAPFSHNSLGSGIWCKFVITILT